MPSSYPVSLKQGRENLRRLWLLTEGTQVRVQGLAWYGAANKIARQSPSPSLIVGAGSIAALSPRCPWERNLQLARKLWKGKPVATLGFCSVYATRILQGEHPLDVLQGPKTRAFYSCIADPEEGEAVCVDTHAFGAWLGRKQHGFRLTDKLYPVVADAYRSVASEVGVTPASLQAVVWCQWRDLHWQRSLY